MGPNNAMESVSQALFKKLQAFILLYSYISGTPLFSDYNQLNCIFGLQEIARKCFIWDGLTVVYDVNLIYETIYFKLDVHP